MFAPTERGVRVDDSKVISDIPESDMLHVTRSLIITRHAVMSGMTRHVIS